MKVFEIISIISLCISIGIGFFVCWLLFFFNKLLRRLENQLIKTEFDRLSNLRQDLIYYFFLNNKPKIRAGNLILAFRNKYNFKEIFDELEKLKEDGLINYPFPRVKDSDSIIDINLEKIN